MTNFKVVYEVVAFTEDASHTSDELHEQFVIGFNETSNEEGLFPQNIVALKDGNVTEDDLQRGKSNIRCFIAVSLIVSAESEEAARAMVPPEGLLTRVADSLCTDENNEVVLHIEGAWRVLYADEEETDEELMS